MTDHLPNCYRNQTMGHYGGGPADCDCGAARRAMVKPASMTDAADKARELVTVMIANAGMVCLPLGKSSEGRAYVEQKIASAIESAVQAERERVEQLRVQLAGCGVAAMGGTTDAVRVKHGDYGHSASYEDVLALRRKYDSERERAGKLVDAAKAYRQHVGHIADNRIGDCSIGPELDIALQAYEVQP